MDVPKEYKQPAVLSILPAGFQYLLLKRAKHPHKELYSPVGGKIDPNESPKQAVIQEAKEEAGIKISNPAFCGTIVETSPTKYNWICFVKCKEEKLKWINQADLAIIPAPKTDQLIYNNVDYGRYFQLSVNYDENLRRISFYDEVNGIDYLNLNRTDNLKSCSETRFN